MNLDPRELKDGPCHSGYMQRTSNQKPLRKKEMVQGRDLPRDVSEILAKY